MMKDEEACDAFWNNMNIVLGDAEVTPELAAEARQHMADCPNCGPDLKARDAGDDDIIHRVNLQLALEELGVNTDHARVMVKCIGMTRRDN